MTDTNADTRCTGCFADKGSTRNNPCPHCGFDETAARPPNALPLRSVLNGQFIVGRVLGKPGGFGITYLAFDQHLQATVAVKEYLPRDLAVRATGGSTILPQSTEEGTLFRYGLEQFLTEARTLAQLNHPNIVRVRQFFEANGSAYLVMDYYQGLSLAEHLEHQPDGRLPEQQAIALMQPILDGLRAVHAKGFLHRDIKPQNIYLARTDSGGVNPILLDFGAARQAMGEQSRSLSVVLSGGYAPFEQYSRKGRQGPWTDVYAAAAVLYRMLTGITPPEATERVEEDELKPAAAFGISQSVSNAIARAMAMDSAARPQTEQAFQRMLTLKLAPGQRIPAPPSAVSQAKAPPAQAYASSAASRPTAAPRPAARTNAPQRIAATPRRGSNPLVGWAFAMLGLVGVIGLFVAMLPSLSKSGNAHTSVSTPATLQAATGQSDADAFAVAQRAGTIAAYQHYLDQCVPQGCGHAAEVQWQIGYLYGTGTGIAEDHEQAVHWYRKAAEQGEARAQSNLGTMYEFGKGIAQDDQQAVYWYRKAAEQGYANGQVNLGTMYEFGKGIAQNAEQAVYWYRKAAEQGYANGQANLGTMYQFGKGIAQNAEQAVYWYRKAAEQGDARAQSALGVMYMIGNGVAQDDSEAVHWFRLSAEQGHVDGQNNLGVMYANGKGVPQDDSEAVRWYRLAAEQGDAVAQYNLGDRYANGKGVPQDDSEAVRWYRLSAEQGDADAQFSLGLMYTNGNGVAQDDSEAVHWYRLSAEQGNANAQNNLDEMHRQGRD